MHEVVVKKLGLGIFEVDISTGDSLMATMTSCLLNEAHIDIDTAIDMKGGGQDPDFRCTECKEPVRPHRSGGHAAAHFEHLERNAACSQSHVERSA
jgi:hypothetical protein